MAGKAVADTTIGTVNDSPVGRRESLALRLSVAASLAIGVVGVVWGLAVDSRIMLFDGLFTFIGTALSLLSLAASRMASVRGSKAYPFGLHASVPIAVVIQGAALLGTLAFALADAVGLLFRGGTEAPKAAVVAYAMLASAVSLAVALALSRLCPESELVRAETDQWKAGAVLSVLIGVGAAAALGLVALGVDWLAPYGDPVLVILAALALAPVALRMVRTGGRELLEAAPPADLNAAISSAAREVGLDRGLNEPVIRATKLGRRLYLEVDYLVDAGRWDVSDEDDVRHDLLARLDGLGYDLWASIELTTDPELAD